MIGIGGADPETAFVDAANRWADAMEHGHESVVLEQKLNCAEIDVTDAARKLVSGWVAARHEELPEWLEAA